VRASDADRTVTLGLLGTQYAEGRLTLDELGRRVDQVLGARSDDTLAGALGGLPVAPRRLRPRFAPWWRRLGAALLDLLAPTGSSSAGALLVAPLGGWAGWGTVTFILLFVVPLPYATICHARRGTLGERVFQIQLRDATDAGAPVRVGQVFGRAVMTYVFGVLFFLGGFLDGVWTHWDVRRQAWHDKVAGTIVVRKERSD